MEILFIILKIIGILLAILLLLGITVTAVPARYRMDIISQDEVKGKVVVHWLLHLVDVRIYYVSKDVSYKLRLFGISIPLDREKKEKPAKKKKERQAETEEDSNIPKENSNQETFHEENANQEISAEKKIRQEVSKEENAVEKNLEKEDSKEQHSEERDLQDSSAERKKRRGRGSRQKRKESFRNFKNKCQAARQNVRQRTADIKNGTTTLKEQIADIKSLILEETNQNALRHLLQEFRYLLGRYAPRKVSGSILFSMGDPARTGKVLGNLSLLPFWSRYKVIVMPEFDSESFFVKGQICIKGHVRLWHVLVSGIRLIKDKNIRKLITSARK